MTSLEELEARLLEGADADEAYRLLRRCFESGVGQAEARERLTALLPADDGPLYDAVFELLDVVEGWIGPSAKLW